MARLFIPVLVLLLTIGIGAQQSSVLRSAQAAEDSIAAKGLKVTPILRSGLTMGKKPIEYPKAGKAEIVSVLSELEPGGRTALHQHPVPTYVYVLEGTVTLQAHGGEVREYKAGQAWLEDMNHWHQAFNKGAGPVRLLVVFVSEEGKPTSISAKPGDVTQ
jgi:quercetin dioxygenase-like cupin family protein